MLHVLSSFFYGTVEYRVGRAIETAETLLFLSIFFQVGQLIFSQLGNAALRLVTVDYGYSFFFRFGGGYALFAALRAAGYA
ncbi:hypothetical protein J4D97_20920, partial [Hymenobacter defluvii]|nr:hypothetical protein [Hymenobacter defluvii]